MRDVPFTIACNGADIPKGAQVSALQLSYLKAGRKKPNVRMGLPTLVRSVFHLSPRVLDLIEIASFLFAADRSCSRGSRYAVDFTSWPRDFRFFIKVRDVKFWSERGVSEKLAELLVFLTGDNSYDFKFQGGHQTEKADLFDEEQFHVDMSVPTDIALFSGGLDSLAGAVSMLQLGAEKLCLVSHRSGQPGTIKTQDALFRALSSEYGDRVEYYKFRTGLSGSNSREETQRTRSFLFSSIAFALSSAYQKDHFYIFENGITSMNLPRREDAKNARSSRTTHPKTIRMMAEFLSLIEDREISIKMPFFWKTKTDILCDLKSYAKQNLVSSSVSCSQTFQPFSKGTQCGVCYQCIDRRFASFASDLDDFDHRGLYNTDFVLEPICDGEAKSGLMGYMAQAKEFATVNSDAIFEKYLTELVDVIDYVDGSDEDEKVLRIAALCKRHGGQVWDAVKKIQMKYDDPTKPVVKGSLLDLLNRREHLKDPLLRLIEDISGRLLRSIRVLYQKEKPKNENRLNDAIEAILQKDEEHFRREYPAIPFALCKTIPDHFEETKGLLIEAKYLRGNLTISKLTDQLGADVFKYPKQNPILFVIYDPDGKIIDEVRFTVDVQSADPRANVLILR